MTAPSDRPLASQDEVPSRETSGEPLTGPVETQMAVQQLREAGFSEDQQAALTTALLRVLALWTQQATREAARRVRAAGGPVPHDAPRAATPAGRAPLADHGLARPHGCRGHPAGGLQVCEPVADGITSQRGRRQEAARAKSVDGRQWFGRKLYRSIYRSL
jgi:hypothetical protein